MAVTFKGQSIGKERGKSGGNGFPRARRKAASSQLHTLDGGNRVQHSGKTMDTLTLNLRCDETELDRLYSGCASSGSLVYSGGTRTAFLDEVGESEELLSPGGSVQWFFVPVTFILT
jgi:hypothetical protein